MFVLFPDLKNNIIFVPLSLVIFSLSALKYRGFPEPFSSPVTLSISLQYTLTPVNHIKNQVFFINLFCCSYYQIKI
jgi:hypothetical protein